MVNGGSPIAGLDERRHPHPLALWVVMVMGISAVASASILIRLADAPALVIASYRVGLATVALGPWLLHQRLRSTARVSGPSLRQAMGSGVFLALHFAFWIQSLQMTSIASSVTLVSTTPVFASLFSRICLREPFDRWMILGVLCSTLGGVWVAGADFRASGEALRGDLLALGGAVMAAGYLVTGRSARRALDLASYTFVAYGVAALVLLLFCAGARLPLWGLSTRTYLALGLLALVPQLIGHTAFNWSLRFLPSTVVAVVLMGEPIGATLLGYLVLREAPAWPKAAGLAILGLGILLCSLSVRRPASPPA